MSCDIEHLSVMKPYDAFDHDMFGFDYAQTCNNQIHVQ